MVPLASLPKLLQAVRWGLPSFYLRDLLYHINGYGADAVPLVICAAVS